MLMIVHMLLLTDSCLVVGRYKEKSLLTASEQLPRQCF